MFSHYLYDTVADCIVAEAHLLSVDKDGYCASCGYKNGLPPEYGEDTDWVNYYECPKCGKITHVDYLVKHYDRCK